MGTRLPQTKGGHSTPAPILAHVYCGQKWHSPIPIFGPCLLWPNGWMDEDATWYAGRPRPRRHVWDWDPAPPKKGRSTPPPLFCPYVYCGQTVGWIKMPVGYGGIDLGLGHMVLDGTSSLPPKWPQQHPFFGPYLLWPNGRPSPLLLSTVCNWNGKYNKFITGKCGRYKQTKFLIK